MSETSPTLDLPLVMPAQAQKHVTVNEALLRLDMLVQAVVESRALDVQPATPAEGSIWIIPDGASGTDWGGYAPGMLAAYRDGFWTGLVPQDGWQVQVRDEAASLVWYEAEGRWRAAAATTVLAQGGGGAATQAVLLEEVLSDVSGPDVVSSIVIPARAIVFCVSVRVMETVTGAASFDCGLAGEASKFGGSLGVTMGASNIGVIGPTAFYADTPIVLTANSADFSGGDVAIAIHAWLPIPPAM